MQIGITAFQFDQQNYKYVGNRYKFYVYPRSFASLDTKFMCQASSLEFLCQHRFDFNRVSVIRESITHHIMIKNA